MKKEVVSLYVLSRSIMLFSLGVIFLSMKSAPLKLLGYEFDLPVGPYRVGGWIMVVVAALLVFVSFVRSWSDPLEQYLEEHPRARFQASVQTVAWALWWIVFTCGWLKAVSVAGQDNGLVFWVGFIVFWVLGMLPWMKRFKSRTC
jgi:hypothetical protein